MYFVAFFKKKFKIREESKKNPNVNFFQKGGGVDPKVYFFKSLYTVKRGFKMDFLVGFESNRRSDWTQTFSLNWSFGRLGLAVVMSVCVSLTLSPSHAMFFDASHWPSDHMITSRPLIGQPSFPNILRWWRAGVGEGGG